MQICDRYTVLRDGALVGSGKVAERTIDGIIRHDGRPARSARSSRIGAPTTGSRRRWRSTVEGL